MFVEAYNMAAQAQQFFPVSALFRILNLDGKDKVLPVIEANEHYQEQMQQMQQQLEQMGQQMEQMQAENQNLRRTATQATNALANMSARRGGAITPGATKVAEAGGGPDTTSAVVNQARNMLGTPVGAEPTM
jgi:TolA-binding protein